MGASLRPFLSTMKKPRKHTRSLHDYSECNDYIEKKYGINTRDYAGLFGPEYDKRTKQACQDVGVDYADLVEDLAGKDNKDPEVQRKLENRKKVYARQKEIEPPYQDFWHWIIDACGVENGGTIVLGEDMIEEDEKELWYAKILNLFLKEFGKKNSEGFLEAEFETSW